jgi:hypothetical protein
MPYVIPYNEQYTKPTIILKYQIKESHNCLGMHKMSYPRPEHQNTVKIASFHITWAGVTQIQFMGLRGAPNGAE